MRRLLVACCLLAASPLTLAWNAAGHRLVAVIAWAQLSPATRQIALQALAAHPDHDQWLARARSDDPAALFAEAATWADDIRDDPRFYDEPGEAPTPPLPGLTDTARHKPWHYVDFAADGSRAEGEIDRQSERLRRIVGGARSTRELAYALPWLLHLIADLHQPLHVGHAADNGGNRLEVENPFNKRLPFTSLHGYWDDLAGPPWLRGKRLQEIARQLLADHPPPAPGDIPAWRDESHALLARVYPTAQGSLLPLVTEEFRSQARQLANRRLVDAGYRLGWLLEAELERRVSRGTGPP